jgi:capsular exopolysaccharide synthesis family protein
VFVTGLFVGIVFLREVSNKRIRTMSDLAVVPGVHPLGGVPDIEDDPREPEEAECVVLEEPNSVTAESVRQIGRGILRAMQNQGHRSLLVTGGLPGAGTTTLISNIAIAGQASGHRVCVLDANFRRPRLGDVMGVEPGVGLGEVLGGEAEVASAIRKGHGDVDVIQAGQAEHRIIERLAGPGMSTVLATLSATYDFILIDSAPSVAAGDAIEIAARTDAAALVILASREERGLVARLVRQLNETQAEMLGVVLNRPRQAIGGYFRRNYEVMSSYGVDDDIEDEYEAKED